MHQQQSLRIYETSLIEPKGKTDKYTGIYRYIEIMIGNFNLCPKTGRMARQEINKDMEDLNTIKQHTLTNIEHLIQQQQNIHFFPQMSMEHVNMC